MITKHRPRKTIILFSIFCAYFLFSLSAFGQPTTAEADFQVRLMNIEAASNEVFRYNATLRNSGTSPTVYELKADLPPGWLVTYRVDGSQVTSLSLDPGLTKDISIEINASLTAEPKKYKIPIKAVAEGKTLDLNLEAVVKGSYELELTTATGRLSDEVLSGSSKEIVLVVKNTGTLPLNNVDFSSQLPSRWEATFEPSNIEQLEAGKSVDVKAKLTVPDKTIAGDYAAKFTAKNENKQSEAAFRIIVKTSLLSGWIGIVIILLAVGLIYLLIRKYGRR